MYVKTNKILYLFFSLVILFITHIHIVCFGSTTNLEAHNTQIEYRPERFNLSPYFSLSLLESEKNNFGIINEGISMDAIVLGNVFSVGVNFGFLHTHKQHVIETQACYSIYSSSRCSSSTVEKGSSFGDYYRISGRFAWSSVMRKSMLNRFGMFINCDLGAIIPMYTYIKNTEDARENNRQNTKLRPSFIGEINIGAIVSLFHFSFGYRYVNVVETPKKTSRNISQLIFNVGLNF